MNAIHHMYPDIAKLEIARRLDATEQHRSRCEGRRVSRGRFRAPAAGETMWR